MSKKYILIIETVTNHGSLSVVSNDWKEVDRYIGSNSNKLSADLIGMILQSSF
jgi:hypothetical protein